MKTRMRTLLLSALFVLTSIGLSAQNLPPEGVEAPQAANSAAEGATKTGSEGQMAFGAAKSSVRPDFGSYVFWAYGLTCVLLFGFTLYTLVQTKKMDERAAYLEERFSRAHPVESTAS